MGLSFATRAYGYSSFADVGPKPSELFCMIVCLVICIGLLHFVKMIVDEMFFVMVEYMKNEADELTEEIFFDVLPTNPCSTTDDFALAGDCCYDYDSYYCSRISHSHFWWGVALAWYGGGGCDGIIWAAGVGACLCVVYGHPHTLKDFGVDFTPKLKYFIYIFDVALSNA